VRNLDDIIPELLRRGNGPSLCMRPLNRSSSPNDGDMTMIKNVAGKVWRCQRRQWWHLSDFLRYHCRSQQHTPIINEREIRVVGMKRSGQHAIISWLQRHCDDRVYHLNNVPVYDNPFRQRATYYPEPGLAEEARGEFTPKELLIVSHEDFGMDQVASARWRKYHDMFVGRSRESYVILVLRDPFNMMASRIKAGMLKTRHPQLSPTELWVQHARVFLGESRYYGREMLVPVNYNQWFESSTYREELSARLGMSRNDLGIGAVSKHGGGSSFDGLHHRAAPQRMDVMGRWRYFRNDATFRAMVDDSTLQKYAYRIFGELEAIRWLSNR